MDPEEIMKLVQQAFFAHLRECGMRSNPAGSR